MLNFFNFQKMITPVVIKIFYIIGIIILIFGAFGAGIYFGYQAESPLLGFGIFIGCIIAQIPFRILCEIMILCFSIHSELVKIRNK